MSEINNFKSYLGNPNLKRSGVSVNWTPELVEEYLKCKKDVVYFVTTYMKIININHGLVNFVPYPYQEQMLRTMAGERYTVIATARQAGKCVTDETLVKIKFLNSKPQTLKIKTVHKVFTFINRYRSSYLFGETYESIGQQIYKDILCFDQKEARKFIDLWGSASHHSKESWWNEITREYCNPFSQGALRCAPPFEQNVSGKITRTTEDASSDMDDVSYKGSFDNKEFSSLRKNEGGLYKNAIRNHEGGKESILWENLGFRTSSPTWLSGETSYGRTEENYIRVDEASLVERYKPFEENSEYDHFTKSKRSKPTKKREVSNRRVKYKEKSSFESSLRDDTAPFEGQTYLRRTEEKATGVAKGSPKVRRDQTKNERGLEIAKREKFIESIELRGFKVFSDNGWVDLYQSHKTVKFDRWELKTTNRALSCADDHIVFDVNLNEVFVKDLIVGSFIHTIDGVEQVTAVYNTNKFEHMYDLGVDHSNHRYYTNGILSHNSTTTCGFILWYIIFHADKTVALLANKGETAREILGKIQLAYQHLPKWLQQGVKEWNKGSFELENNSRVIAAATSSDNIRGFAINLLFIDEAAFIENWDTFFTSVYPTISSGTESKIVLVSTPNGLNHFYKIWQNALEERNQYKAIKVLWQDVPGRDEEWRKNTIAGMNFDTEKFEQEYCVEFMGSSGTLIAGWKLKELVHKTPILKKDGLQQYKPQENGNSYVCIADVSHGKGLDYSAFSIIDVTKMPYDQVCVYKNNMVTPIDYADVVHRVCKSYNNATILIEINDIGGQVANSLHFDFEYDNILFTESAGRNGKRITSGFGSNVDKGIRTTKTVKSVGCSILKLLVEQNQLILNDFDTINELSTFSRKGTSYEAEPGKNDDVVMGLVLFGWLSDQPYFKDYTNINTLAMLRDKTEEDIMQDLTPFGFVDDGMPPEDPYDIPKPRGWMSDDPENVFL
jgi:hypothetical protein